MRPTLLKDDRRSYAVYVLLRPAERKLLERVREGRSRGAVLRDAFLAQYPQEEPDGQ